MGGKTSSAFRVDENEKSLFYAHTRETSSMPVPRIATDLYTLQSRRCSRDGFFPSALEAFSHGQPHWPATHDSQETIHG